ncbi:hypothetical protein GGR51DRAFT_120214 [Nemania sp. FL0031]|nr:hypothetical protein GGR51DRAFT_120214 [Nemania sp. FL0031]
MQLYLLHAALMAGTIAARKDPRQVIVTVTEGVPLSPPSAPTPIPISAAPVPWEQSQGADSSSTSTGDPALPPLQPPTAASPVPVPVPVPSGSIGARCGKGYTYCGYMLTGVGHNFAQADIQRSYCNGLPELCVGGKEKTNAEQAVFVCMSEQPPVVQLLCACSGTCLNNATTNFIAHCDKACVND